MGRVAVRPPGRLLPLLLLLALLSGCAGGGAASASEDEEPQAPLLMEHGCLSMDLDGDGAEEARPPCMPFRPRTTCPLRRCRRRARIPGICCSAGM